MRSLSWVLPFAVSFGMVSANAADVKCPPDVYSPDYEQYLENSRKRVGFTVEPQVYGSLDKLDKLSSEFEKLSIGSGIVFVFSDLELTKLHVANCDNCSQTSYQTMMAQCNAALGARCIDFAVVVDGKAQCMLIPKPEI